MKKEIVVVLELEQDFEDYQEAYQEAYNAISEMGEVVDIKIRDARGEGQDAVNLRLKNALKRKSLTTKKPIWLTMQKLRLRLAPRGCDLQPYLDHLVAQGRVEVQGSGMKKQWKWIG